MNYGKAVIVFMVFTFTVLMFDAWIDKAHGWTNHSFHVEQDMAEDWYVTTFTEELRKKYKKAWKRGEIYEISITQVKGQEPEVQSTSYRTPYRVIDLVSVWLNDFVDAIRREMPDLEQVVLTFYYPINEISSYTYSSAFKNKEIHEKLVKVLNEQRDRVSGEKSEKNK